MRRGPVAAATAVTLAGVASGVGLALLLVPRLTGIVATTPLWRRSVLVAAALLMPLLIAWCAWALRPLRQPTTLAACRRAALDFPFRVARLCVAAALLSGVATGAGLWGAHPDEPAAALAAGVVTYLVLVLPVIAIYLGTRQALYPAAAGDAPVRSVRQPVGLRLMLAFQFPVIVSMAGLVLVDQYNDIAYHRTLARFYQEQYAQALSRVLLSLDEPLERAETLAEVRPPDGIEPRAWTVPGTGATSFGLIVEPRADRALDLRLMPFVLLFVVTLLGALLGRWLATELTGELHTVERVLRALRTEASPAVPTGAFALRETGALVVALNDAIAAFRDRDRVVREAAEGRRRAEQAKSRFLAHLSHELKSPLNSILGFSEVLLAGIDGELTPEQRDQLAIVWRSGDMLLRYILTLLDLARLEASYAADGPVDARRLGFEPAPLSAADLEQSIRRQWRTDPLHNLRLLLRNDAPTPDAPVCFADPARTARAVVLGAGMLLDVVESGTVQVICRLSEGALTVEVTVIEAEADDLDRRQLRDQLAAAQAQDRPVHIGAAATILTLLRQVVTAQGGLLEVELDAWPRLRFRLPLRDLPLPGAGAAT